MGEEIVVLLVFLLIGAVIITVLITHLIIKKKYISFIEEHSLSLRKIKEINSRYHFKEVKNFDMNHSYDNLNMYNDISCKDYLVYELVYLQKQVKEAIKDASFNKDNFDKYTSEIKESVTFNTYDTNELPKNLKRLNKYERKITSNNLLLPVTELKIAVSLTLTNINGVYKTSKKAIFYSQGIENIITDLNKKRGVFYLNNDIWQSICRVERGKVTNKMRFAIYKRDNYRCRKCGRKTNDLEVDHIYPIAKGGKSTYDNLQTLCHRCNVKKGANVE